MTGVNKAVGTSTVPIICWHMIGLSLMRIYDHKCRVNELDALKYTYFFLSCLTSNVGYLNTLFILPTK